MKWGVRGGIEKKASRAWLKKLRALWRCQSGPDWSTGTPPEHAAGIKKEVT